MHKYVNLSFLLLLLPYGSYAQTILTPLKVKPNTTQAIGSTIEFTYSYRNEPTQVDLYVGNSQSYRCFITASGANQCLDTFATRYPGSFSGSQLITPNEIFVTVNLTTVNSTFDGVQISLQNIANDVLSSVTLNVKPCTAITEEGLTSTLSQTPCGFGCTGDFTCAASYIGGALGTCQANATWNVQQPVCSAVCNNTNIPTNSTFQAPTSGTTVSPNTQTLNCIGNYAGTVTAQCLADGNWNIISYDCNGTCDQRMIPSDISLNNSLMAVLQVGESVIVPCNAGNVTYIGIAYANCTGPGQWESSNCSAVCVIPQRGDTSETYCSTTSSSLQIVEGDSIIVQCCVNPRTTASASCSHVGVVTAILDCTVPPQGLDPGIIALIVILCLLAFGGIVVVVVLYKRKLACFADNEFISVATN